MPASFFPTRPLSIIHASSYFPPMNLPQQTGPPNNPNTTLRPPQTPSTPRTSSLGSRKGISPVPNTPSNAGNSSGIPSFRALRNLLPFGPGKNQTPVSPNVSLGGNATGKTPFLNFGSVRRSMSMTVDGRKSLQIQRDKEPSQEEEESVMLIHAEASALVAEGDGRLSRPRSFDPFRASPSATPALSSMFHPLPKLSPAPSLSLSLPPSPNPNPNDLSTIEEADTSGISKHLPAPSSSGSSSHRSQRRTLSRRSTTGSGELNFSTEDIRGEVLGAMMGDWGVSPPPSTLQLTLTQGDGDDSFNSDPPDMGDEDGTVKFKGAWKGPEESFNLAVVDPDLAALLSPNRHPTTPSSGTMVKKAGGKPLPSLPPPTKIPSPRRKDFSPTSLTFSRPEVDLSQSTKRPTGRLGLARAVSAAVTSTSTAIPLLTSTPSRPSGSSRVARRPQQPQRPSTGNSNSSSTFTPSPASPESPRRGSLDSATALGRSAPPSPLSPGGGGSGSGGKGEGRLWNPVSRHASYAVSRWKKPTPSPTSSSHHEEEEETGRNRKRSMSVNSPPPGPTHGRGQSLQIQTQSQSRPSSSLSSRPRLGQEWLGPRTVKAFAAAGLLDHDSPGSETRSSSRLGRERSVSRAMTVSSETPPTPRTGGSGSGSTAPTSISQSSTTTTNQMVQQLKEKHEVETGALLAALSDSQRVVKVLREENERLRERVRGLEREVEGANRRLEDVWVAAMGPTTEAAVSVSGSSHRGATRVQQSHRASISEAVITTPPKREREKRRKWSNASSVFPVPPVGMSMLLADEDAPRPPSSTFSSAHARRTSVSSSILAATDVGGSPGSLFLRPEHELHLGNMDMVSLDLGREDNLSDEEF